MDNADIHHRLTDWQSQKQTVRERPTEKQQEKRKQETKAVVDRCLRRW